MSTRTSSSIKNFKWAIIGQTIGLLVSFLSRIFFVHILGKEYLGVNGLFTNILTVLSLAELGVGTAINYSLYKPLAAKDTEKCNMLMQFYRKVYIVIGFIILLIGCALTPFLNLLIKEMPNIANIQIIYILFVLNTAVSYFFSYKRNLIIADQNRYIATIYRYGFYTLMNVVQCIFLIITKNYILFLIIQIIFTILENIFVSIRANKMYPYLLTSKKVPLDNETKNDIIKNTKAMMMHKVGTVVVTSTDNIIISKYVGLVSVGLYSNYYLITTAINQVFSQIFTSIIASVGNLCVSESKEKQYTIFKRVFFLNFWIYFFVSICLMTLFNPFIELWVGKDYLFNNLIVLIIVVNVYLLGIRKTVLTFREASGLFYKDRYKPIAEAIINLITSIILAKYIGIAGVFIGTIISSLTTCVWIEPYVLFKYGFKTSSKPYFFELIKKTLLTVIIGVFVYYICSFINCNKILSFLIKGIICVLIPNIIMILIYRKTDEFNYFLSLAKSKIKLFSSNH